MKTKEDWIAFFAFFIFWIFFYLTIWSGATLISDILGAIYPSITWGF